MLFKPLMHYSAERVLKKNDQALSFAFYFDQNNVRGTNVYTQSTPKHYWPWFYLLTLTQNKVIYGGT